MQIEVVGGGPGGLYFAILMQKRFPGARIRVTERNQPGDTFGFGVVFSDATLDALRAADEPSYRAITARFAYWDDIEVRAKGQVTRIGGNGFCGCARMTLLGLLQERAQRLGVELRHGVEFDPHALPEADLIVAADGINSRIRTAHAAHFGPELDLRPNRFVWMGSTRPLDAFTFVFKETDAGTVILHAYQYEPGRSTWIFEVTPTTFERLGLAEDDEAGTRARMEALFADELGGHRLLANRSIWRRFPMIRNRAWVKDNIVLIGDAKATAHFSIGSGTKLAMEDAIALAGCFVPGRAVTDALSRFETTRREDVERTQHAADVSLVWFEHVERFRDADPLRFAFGLMTRSKAITYDNLRLRAPGFVAAVDRAFAGSVDEPLEGPGGPLPPVLQSLRLREMTLPNRIVLSPMCMYSAEDGLPGDFHLVHLGARALGGAGLIFTEMTCVAADARITLGCAGLWNDAQQDAWARIVSFIHANSAAKVALQLGHAGRKGATKLMWEGMDQPLDEGAWPILSASAIPWLPHSQVPRAMDRDDMDQVKAAFLAAAERGAAAGFDMLELHAAHGYLLASFLSPLTNRRSDEHGGPVENRMRYPLEVFRAMRAAWPADRPMSVRISASDWAEGGVSAADVLAIARGFRDAGCDLMDVSTGQTVHDSAPQFGRMWQVPFADQIRAELGMPTMCVGNIVSADQANTILAAGRADLVAFARPHLVDPAFALKAAAQYGHRAQPVAPQYASGFDQLLRNTAREVEELRTLRLAARPSRHAAAAPRQAAE